MPCHLLLAKVAVKAGDQILGSLDQLVPGLDKTLSAKTRTEAVKQEVCSLLRLVSSSHHSFLFWEPRQVPDF